MTIPFFTDPPITLAPKAAGSNRVWWKVGLKRMGEGWVEADGGGLIFLDTTKLTLVHEINPSLVVEQCASQVIGLSINQVVEP